LAKPRLTIIGSGNAGLAAAYHFGLRGNDVCLYGSPGFDEPLRQIHDRGGVQALETLEGASLAFPGFQPVALLTDSVAEAVAYADILIMPVPSYAQEVLFRLMLPHLRNGQTVFLMPGNFGSLALTKVKNDEGYRDLDLTFLDAISIPWACRITGEAEIAIFGMKKYLPVAALPAKRTQEMIGRLEEMMPLPLTPLENVIAAGLDNINFGGHPLMTVLNIGLLENFSGKFDYYRDCCSPATARAVAVMEEERLAVGCALGLRLVPELEAMNRLYGLLCRSVYEFNRSSTTHGAIHGAPDSSRHRYIIEDVPYLLVPCHGLGKLAGVPTPVVDSCIHLAGTFNETDYLAKGRTREKMGLKGLTIPEIRARID
jgi:opine dehydrogenase